MVGDGKGFEGTNSTTDVAHNGEKSVLAEFRRGLVPVHYALHYFGVVDDWLWGPASFYL